MKTSPKAKPVDTTNLQPGELIHMGFSFYGNSSIHWITSMLTVFLAKTRMLWVSHTAPKPAPVRIILFILITLKS